MIWRKISGPGVVGKLEKRWDGKVSEGKDERGEVNMLSSSSLCSVCWHSCSPLCLFCSLERQSA